MPFVQRVVNPKYLSRVSLHDENGRPRVKDDELEAVTNFTLCSALRQLASVVQLAGDIFIELNKELVAVKERTGHLKERIVRIEKNVQEFDPKAITVPESDLTEFWHRKEHFTSEHEKSVSLFTSGSRPTSVQKLYEAAASPPKILRRQGSVYNVTPVLGPRSKRNILSEIDGRKPAIINHLRRWTSSEALGSVTVDADCTIKVAPGEQDVTDHTLPSPEEQVQAVALKFPPEVVAVDVTGRNFERMSSLRRSLVSGDEAVKRRSNKRRPRGKRRNTIAGTDTTKELAVIVGDSSDTNLGKTSPEVDVAPNSFEKKSHLENLKEWGRSRLRLIKNSEPAVRLRGGTQGGRRKLDKEELCVHSSSGNWSQSSESGHSTATSHVPRSSISSGSVCPKHKRPPMTSASSSVTSESTTLTPDDGETCSMYSCDTEGYYTSFHLDSGLKTLREEEPPAPAHTSSALSVNSSHNNSTLTAESEYELFGRGSTSTTASSAGTVCTTLLIPPAPSVPERVCSQLSSGNKTLPERTQKISMDTRETQSLKLNKKPDLKMLSFEEVKQINNETNQSNLTRSNVTKHDVTEAKNCVITVDVHHDEDDDDDNSRQLPEKCGDSPDSGHNTCSSPVDSIASPSSPHDLELLSECSDLEGVERVERIREKTTMSASRIPSMCVITPPHSDDEYVTIAEVKGTIVPASALHQSPVRKFNNFSYSPQEFVCLTELPKTVSAVQEDSESRRTGARVTLNAEGKVVFSSDSLKRIKAVRTTATFEPGPCVASIDTVASNQGCTTVLQRANTAAVRPMNAASPLFANRKVITPNPVHRSPTKQPVIVAAMSPPSSRKPINNKQYFSPETGQLLEKHNTTTVSQPISPLASPTSSLPRNPPSSTKTLPLTRNPTSPRMVVKALAVSAGRPHSPVAVRGAYVNVNRQNENDKLLAVKRSDSYRLANEDVFDSSGARRYPSSTPSPLISAVNSARTTKEGSSSSIKEDFDQDGRTSYSKHSSQESYGTPDRSGQLTWPRSTSTPTKSNSASSPMDFSMVPSPIQSPSVSSPKTARSAMDLYAVIHESKKRIQNLQKPKAGPIWPKAIPAKSVIAPAAPISPALDSSFIKGIPQPMPPLNNINQLKYVKTSGYNSLPRLQVQKLDESPKNLAARKVYPRRELIPSSPALARPPERTSLASDRLGPTQPTSRNDFKRLLLQKGWGGAPPAKESAMERLKGRATAHIKPINYDVLSSTIPEDRSDEDELNETQSQRLENPSVKPTLAPSSNQNKSYKKSKITLETAL
ncbi:WAS protein family, member [Nesidiocoris tenuis]|uniref:WAS protein family, member n=1 Tax=Nesidiocoris tenuis TaxID=355587 RepID=A0ABN7A687_9HEMI|nr:WAS protein family, member [Nesidiocoris tenuis]